MDPAVLLIAVLGFTFIVALFVGIRSIVVTPRDEVLERVHRVTTSAEFPVAGGHASRAPRRSLIAAAVRPLSRLIKPEDGKELSKARLKLAHAGYRGEYAVEVFLGSKVALSVTLAGAILVIYPLLLNAMRRDPSTKLWMLGVLMAAIGFFAPNLWLDGKVKERQIKLSKALPDTLDLMVTCVEAGLGVEAALSRVMIEIALSSPLLSTELRQTTNEIQAGVARADAFRKLAERTGLSELRTLSATLIQTEMFGTSVAMALRIHSDAMRTRRTHRAEEAAATVAVKMMLPLIFFILPSLFAVILGPAIIRITQTLVPALAR
ncbi:MAG: type II secretion system F family protein [Myxococcales bacterium]|nr:type II secretion system F family protein [Myxococcales bacterium]